MKPIKFKESNVSFGEEQPQYEALPAFYDKESESGEVISCWELSQEEIEEVVKTGCIWLSQMSFHRAINPVFLTPYKEAVITHQNNE